MFYIYIIKRFFESVAISPLIYIGRLFYKSCLFQKEYKIIFFFPFYHIGGAEKVHAQIAAAVGNSNCLIIFTKRSGNNLFLEQFKKSNCDIIDISKFTDNKWLYPITIIYRGIISANINNQKNKPIIFNGQSNFGYKVSPWIKSSIHQIELIHSFNSFSWIRLPFIPFYASSIMISKIRITDHLTQYQKLGVPKKYNERIKYILNGINLPSTLKLTKNNEAVFKVLYVGRGTAEKRVHLIAQMANMLSDSQSNIQFHFAGELKESIPTTLHPACYFYGNIKDENILNTIYQEVQVLILTSCTEGFPMVIMEAMANGCAILSTPVGDIPIHVQNNVNGCLLSSVTNEDTIIKEGVLYIKKLFEDRILLKKIRENNIQYAKNNFDIKKFNTQYKELIDRYT